MTRQTLRLSQLRIIAAFTFVACSLVAGAAVQAHPLSQGAIDVVVHPDRVDVRARVTFEEVAVTDMLTASPADAFQASVGGPAAMSQAYARHAKYVAAHVHVSADGRPLVGTVKRVIEPAGTATALPPITIPPPTTGPATAPATRPAPGPVDEAVPDSEHVIYEIEYRPAAAGGTLSRPQRVDLRQDVLVGLEFAPGVTWEASYVMRIGTGNGPVDEGLLLTSADPVSYDCDWAAADAAAASGASGPPPVRVDTWRLARDYAYHGVHHILVGYDHLLFIGALVLAARSLWDLVKVVSVFTLAHTITLALSALDVVRLPDGIVEPMIAGSIVFVALQNVLWPKHTTGWLRLAAAFFFGLFHGLGYAGGLIEAMEGMSSGTVLLAILAFSVGVEVGHQVVVLPLFGALKLARQSANEPAARDRISLGALRYGSAVICVAGLYYFVAAVSAGLSSAGPAS